VGGTSEASTFEAVGSNPIPVTKISPADQAATPDVIGVPDLARRKSIVLPFASSFYARLFAASNWMFCGEGKRIDLRSIDVSSTTSFRKSKRVTMRTPAGSRCDAMKVTDYDQFVRKTTQFSKKSPEERQAIAFYGLVSEIGSLVAAVKKKLLSEGGEASWDQPNDEIKEELGDALWYCYASAQAANHGNFDVLASDISNLRQEIGNNDERARKIALVLNPAARQAFLKLANSFPPGPDYTFDDYQQLANKTARTDGRVLLEVCIAVVWQLGAELLRPTLPEIEITLNRNIADRPTNVVLAEIAWHLSAMASLYNLSLDEVVAFNCQKVNYRKERGTPTPLHDADRDPKEQFPRTFDVSFVRIGAGKSRMYANGRSLGNDLTDNAYEDDGYRFHDVIHLALVAHLGWSPVLRGLMKRKRKDDRIDEVEDGGRAKVVEELVISAIHSESKTGEPHRH
jgi:NTP pyrophosphatase (non-canonical NTP hydrolase)